MKTYVYFICGVHVRVVHALHLCKINLLCKLIRSSTVGHQGWICNSPFDWMNPGDLQWISARM